MLAQGTALLSGTADFKYALRTFQAQMDNFFQGDGMVRDKMVPMSVALIPADEEIGQEIYGPEPCELIVVAAPKKMI